MKTFLVTYRTGPISGGHGRGGLCSYYKLVKTESDEATAEMIKEAVKYTADAYDEVANVIDLDAVPELKVEQTIAYKLIKEEEFDDSL